jgi:hypothetical protein
MSGWRIWAAATGLMALCCAYALLNFMAAADLGYDVSAEGRSVLRFWEYAALACLAASLLTAAIALYRWRSPSRR